MKSVFSGVAAAAWLVAPLPAAPHHAFSAEFDVNQPVELTGTVTRMEWTNPHAWLFIDAEDRDGNVGAWAVELVGINDLLRLGWGRSRVSEGDVITVSGFRARNGTNTANARSVSFAETGELLWDSAYRGQ